MRGLRYFSMAGKLLYPSLLWKMPSGKRTIYLTFDDGPVPGITPWVLFLLKQYDAKATFFCIGDNIRKNPDLFRQLITEGHSVGNHSYNHLNGWKTPTHEYTENVFLAEEAIGKALKGWNVKEKTGIAEALTKYPHQKMFRPPYGRIKRSQLKKLKAQGYSIIMWDIISGDYDLKRSAKSCYNEVIRQAGPGSIIVFHDSIKASNNLKQILPDILEFLHKKDFKFEAL